MQYGTIIRRIVMAVVVLHIGTVLGGACRAEIRVERGIHYLAEGRKEKADLYLPADIARSRPAILVLHGGGWISEQRDSNREVNIATRLAEHGYVCMSIDYWMGDPQGPPQCLWPQNIHDCKTAVRWLREHADTYHIDAQHIGAIGGSAGGHLAAMLAVTGPECGLDPAGPFADQSTRIQCAVDMYGPVDIENWIDDIQALAKKREEAPELYRAFSVLTYVSPDDAPVLIIQGTADQVVPVAQSKAFADKLQHHGVPHHLEIIEGGGHSHDLESGQTDLRPQVFAFFDKYLREPHP